MVSKIYKIIIITFVILSFTACKEQIQHDLTENDANKYISKLIAADFSVEKIKQSDGKWSIAVDKEQASAAIKFLSDARIVKNNTVTYNDKNALLSSREDQKFKFERALSHELENTLLSIENVLDARVHLNLPASDPILGNRLQDAKGSGSVLLVVNNPVNLNNEMVAGLIAGASGIDKSAISVIFNEGKQEENHETQQNLAAKIAKNNESENPAKTEFLYLTKNLSGIQNTGILITLVAITCVGFVTLIIRKRKVAFQNSAIGVLNDFEGDIL